MDNKYLFLVKDENEEIVYSTYGPEDCFNIVEYALLVKSTTDVKRQLDCEPITECVEVWALDESFRMHLLATFF